VYAWSLTCGSSLAISQASRWCVDGSRKLWRLRKWCLPVSLSDGSLVCLRFSIDLLFIDPAGLLSRPVIPPIKLALCGHSAHVASKYRSRGRDQWRRNHGACCPTIHVYYSTASFLRSWSGYRVSTRVVHADHIELNTGRLGVNRRKQCMQLSSRYSRYYVIVIFVYWKHTNMTMT